MKKFISLMCCALAMTFAFTACSDDDTNVTPEISARPTAVTFSADGETKSVAVTSNVAWTYVNDAEWLTITKGEGELTIVAEANTALEPRTTTITLNADEATCTIEVTQEKGSKYPGYTELSTLYALYSGTMYQMFMPDCEGGSGIIELTSEDERTFISIEYFTTPFGTEEELVVEEGTYTKGDAYEAFPEMALQGTPMTYVTGGKYILSDEEGDEEFAGGTTISFTTGDITEDVYCVDGSFSITANDDGTYLIKTDFLDAEGNEYKYYYEGEFVYDTEGAVFPNAEVQDPSVVESAMITYNGDSGFGTTSMTLMLTSTSGATTNITYYIPTTTFEAITDYTATMVSPEGDNTGAVNTLDKGSMLEMEGFSFPMGTYIMFGFGDYFVADGASTALIAKEEGAETYTVIANLSNIDEENYILMGTGLTIEIIDGTAYEDEEW